MKTAKQLAEIVKQVLAIAGKISIKSAGFLCKIHKNLVMILRQDINKRANIQCLSGIIVNERMGFTVKKKIEKEFDKGEENETCFFRKARPPPERKEKQQG
jgi:hypothetical protein